MIMFWLALSREYILLPDRYHRIYVTSLAPIPQPQNSEIVLLRPLQWPLKTLLFGLQCCGMHAKFDNRLYITQKGNNKEALYQAVGKQSTKI